MGDAFILDTVRTPRGRGKAGKGALSGTHPQELVAQLLNALAARNNLTREDVQDLILGIVSQVGEQGACLARPALLAAGWPDEVTGTTLNRFCGSGLQAVNFAAMGVMSGQQQLVIGGGVESMSRVAMGSDGGMLDGNNMKLRENQPLVPQGISADLIATMEGFTRDDVDKFALQSQKKAAIAVEGKRFDKSIIPVVDDTGKVLLTKDEHARPDTTPESLAKLEPSFVMMGAALDPIALKRYPDVKAINHVHTAGNSSGIVDGAGLVLLGTKGYADAHGPPCGSQGHRQPWS